MEAVHIQERPQLNDTIEDTFLRSAEYARDIMKFNQTERGASILNIYDGFFKEFSLLVILTSDLPQLRNAQEEISGAQKWIHKKGIVKADEDEILERCKEGVRVFLAFKKVLSAQCVISLPVS